MILADPIQQFHLLPGTRRRPIKRQNRLFLTIGQVVEELQVNERTVRRWIKGRKVTAQWTGGQWRIHRLALNAFLNRRQAPPRRRKPRPSRYRGVLRRVA